MADLRIVVLSGRKRLIWGVVLPASLAIQTAMVEPRDELLRLFKRTLKQCRETQEFWRDNDFRLTVGGIDITEAERAASEGRIEHLETLIAAMERGVDED